MSDTIRQAESLPRTGVRAKLQATLTLLHILRRVKDLAAI